MALDNIPILHKHAPGSHVVALSRDECADISKINPPPRGILYMGEFAYLIYSMDNKGPREKTANLYYEHHRIIKSGRKHNGFGVPLRMRDMSTVYTWLEITYSTPIPTLPEKPFSAFTWWNMATKNFTTDATTEYNTGTLVQYLGNSSELELCMYACGYPWDICGLIEHEILIFV